ncbi:hypothetical protein [Aeromonas sp. S16(2024)]|uniref:hypothetical protein n=1 Tax=Aeromonas sp. S16(2024) TaxID=3242889 RepID=UPI003526ED2E
MILYRGVKDPIEDGLYDNPYIKNPRKPRNTNELTHSITDEWFEIEFGIKARSRTIFCSTDKEQAVIHGHPYVISFPEGGEFIFSEQIYDFTEIEGELGKKSQENKDEVEKWLASKNYQKVGTVNEIPVDFCGEIMACCEKYVVQKIK